MHEALLHNENAVLFPGRTPAALADQVEKLATDRPFRLKIAERGMQLVRSSYSWKQYAENVFGLFRQFVSEGAADRKLPQELTVTEP